MGAYGGGTENVALVRLGSLGDVWGGERRAGGVGPALCLANVLGVVRHITTRSVGA